MPFCAIFSNRGFICLQNTVLYDKIKKMKSIFAKIRRSIFIMRKKTKFLTILLIAAIALFAATNTAASCKKDPPKNEHVCSFEKTWTYDQTEHWHKCIGEGECDKVSDKAAHTWNDGKVTKEPTYTEKGEKTYTCTVCPATKTEELPIKQHVCSFEDAWTYNQAEHWHKCIGEGAAPCDKVSEKAAHTWNNGEVTKEPTYTEKGEKTYTCTVCPATKTEELPVKQHVCSFEKTWTYNQTEHWHKCIGEGECDKVSDKAAHTWNDGEVTKEPTYTEKGEKTYTCTVCPATKTEETASVPLPDENEAWEKMQSLAKKAKENDSYGVRVYGGRSDTLDQGTYKQEFVFNADGKSASKVYAVEEEGTFTSYTALMQYGGKYYRAEAVSESSAFTVIEVKEITEYFAKTSASTSRNMLARFIGSKEDLTDYLIEQVYSALYWMCDKDGNPVNVTKEDITTKITVKGSENKIIIAITATVDPEKVKKMWYEGLSFTSYESTVSFTFGDDAFCKFEYSNDNGYVKDGKAGSLRGVQSIEVLAEPDYELYDQAVKAADLSNVDLSKVEPYTVNVRVYNDIYAHKLDHVTDFDAAVTDDAYKALQKEAHDIIYKINVYFKENLTARFYADENKTVPIDENYKFGYVCSDLGLITTVYIDISPADKTKVLATYTYEKRSVSEDGSSNSQTRNEYVLVDKNSDYEIATGYMYEYFDDEITVNGEKITDKKVKVGEKNLTIHCLKLLGPDEDTNFITNHVNCTESDEYGFDENNHWKKCTLPTCDNKLKLGAHQWDGGVIIEEATEEKPGVKKYTCEICGYDKNQSYTITPDVPEPEDPAAAAFEKMLAAAEKTRKNKPAAVKKNFNYITSGARMSTETIALADGRSARLSSTVYGTMEMTTPSYTDVIDGAYVEKTLTSNGNSYSVTISPVTEYYAKNAHSAIIEQLLAFCRNKEASKALYFSVMQSFLDLGVFDDATDNFFVLSESDIEYWVTIASGEGYDLITLSITLTDQCMKSIHGGAGERLSMGTLNVTIKYTENAITDITYYQGFTYSLEGQTVTSEFIYEYSASDDANMTLFNQVKAEVDKQTTTVQAEKRINGGIYVSGVHLESFTCGVTKGSLYSAVAPTIKSCADSLEEIAPGRFVVEAYMDQDYTIPLTADSEAGYSEDMSPLSVYLRVRSVSGNECIAMYKYWTSSSDMMFSMNSRLDGEKTVIFTKSDNYKLETTYYSVNYTDLIRINNSATKSTVLDASGENDLFVIECHKRGNPSQNGDSSEITG